MNDPKKGFVVPRQALPMVSGAAGLKLPELEKRGSTTTSDETNVSCASRGFGCGEGPLTERFNVNNMEMNKRRF
jgi:hypothetical protein